MKCSCKEKEYESEGRDQNSNSDQSSDSDQHQSHSCCQGCGHGSIHVWKFADWPKCCLRECYISVWWTHLWSANVIAQNLLIIDYLVYDWVDTCSLWFSMLSWLFAIGFDYFYTKPTYCVLDSQLWCVFALSLCKSGSLISRLIIGTPTDELWPFNDDQNLTERAIILRIIIHLKLTSCKKHL